jgi:hypothetical protein
MSKPTFVYVTYIAASLEKVWQALTEGDLSEKYWFGYRVTASGKAGERMTAVSLAGSAAPSHLCLAAALQRYAGRAAVARHFRTRATERPD